MAKLAMAWIAPGKLWVAREDEGRPGDANSPKHACDRSQQMEGVAERWRGAAGWPRDDRAGCGVNDCNSGRHRRHNSKPGRFRGITSAKNDGNRSEWVGGMDRQRLGATSLPRGTKMAMARTCNNFMVWPNFQFVGFYLSVFLRFGYNYNNM